MTTEASLGEPAGLGGLSEAEVRSREQAGLTNAAPAGPGRSVTEILRANVLTRFNAILGALFVVVVVVGPIQDELFGVVLVVNTAVGITQELRARHVLSRLAVLTAPRARVVRGGIVDEVVLDRVVLDDVILLEPGDQVPVDGVILESDGLEVDESLLTGEAEPVGKAAGEPVLSGSIVAAGTAYIRANRVGASAYARTIESDARRFQLVRSELRQGTDRILRLVTWVMVPVGAALFVEQLLTGTRRGSGVDAVRGSVAGVAAMVPEGLVLLTSVAFAVGAIRLARHRVLVQELAAVEGLARVDVLCFDKTGTLTDPRMRPERLELLGEATLEEAEAALHAVVGADPSPNATARAVLGDLAPPNWALTARVPFESGRRWSAASFEGRGTWVLGAPEVLAPARPRGPSSGSDEPVRELMLARAGGPLVGRSLPAPLEPVATISLRERLRPEAAATVRYLLGQGVTLKVLSGDAPATASAVARRAGVPDPDGADATVLDDAGLAAAVASGNVLGRVDPYQKRAAVRALQQSGHVVAMVGDGVNDALALKQADLGIALGSGSPSTRAVAQVVLTDASFASVPSILGEGRRVVANVERVANLFVTKTVYAALLAIAVVASRTPFPFLPRHLTIVSTLTIGVPSFFLAFAPGAPRAVPGFTSRVLAFTVPAGFAAAVAAFSAYEVALRTAGVTLVEARTTALLELFCFGIWVLILVARPFTVWRVALVATMAGAIVVPFATAGTRLGLALALPPSAVLLEATTILILAIAGLQLFRRWRREAPSLPLRRSG